MLDPQYRTRSYVVDTVVFLRKSDHFPIRECIARVVAVALALFALSDLILHAIHLPLRAGIALYQWDFHSVVLMVDHGDAMMDAIDDLFFGTFLLVLFPDPAPNPERKISIGTIVSNIKTLEAVKKQPSQKITPHLASNTLNLSGFWVWQRNQYPFPDREQEIHLIVLTTLSGLTDLFMRELTTEEINEYCNKMAPLIKSYLKDPEGILRLQNLFTPIITGLTPQQIEPLFTGISAKNGAIKQIRWVNRLVTLTKREIPENILLKLLQGTLLTKEEEKTLSSWMESLDNTPEATATHLLRSLRQIILKSGQEEDKVGALLYKLYCKYPCSLLTRPDPLLIEKRNKMLEEGVIKIALDLW